MNSSPKTGFKKAISGLAILIFFTIWGLVIASEVVWAEPESMRRTPDPIVVIDPGHGGRDVGARGPTGLMEKSVTLELARQIAMALEPQYKVILTRSDDYAVDLPQRAATANHSKADLLVSLHTGSGFLHRKEGVAVFYYAPLKETVRSDAAPANPSEAQRWNNAHLRHKAASIVLAKTLIGRLSPVAGSGDQKIQGMALKLLEGVNLPAVLVEVGHITHPATEMHLSSVQGIEQLSHALAEGIRQYIMQRTANRHTP